MVTTLTKCTRDSMVTMVVNKLKKEIKANVLLLFSYKFFAFDNL